ACWNAASIRRSQSATNTYSRNAGGISSRSSPPSRPSASATIRSGARRYKALMRPAFAQDFVVRPLNLAVDGPALHAIYGDEESCRYLTRPAMATVEETVAMIRQWENRDDINW